MSSGEFSRPVPRLCSAVPLWLYGLIGPLFLPRVQLEHKLARRKDGGREARSGNINQQHQRLRLAAGQLAKECELVDVRERTLNELVVHLTDNFRGSSQSCGFGKPAPRRFFLRAGAGDGRQSGGMGKPRGGFSLACGRSPLRQCAKDAGGGEAHAGDGMRRC